jgi:hypothetical protein
MKGKLTYDSVVTKRFDSPYGEHYFEFFDAEEDEYCDFFIDDEI